jgi:long-chain acyl-CoA synthetase
MTEPNRVQVQAVPSEASEADTLIGFLDTAARNHEGRTALRVLRGGRWDGLTYGELRDRAEAWGRVLSGAGVGRGDRVLLVSENSLGWVVAFFALILQEAVAVPLDPELGERDILALSDKTQARVWLVSRRVRERVGCAAAEGADRREVFDVDAFADLPGESSLTDERIEQEASRTPEVTAGHAASQWAFMPFTSGTTLAPKGVPLTHANLLADLRAIRQVVSIRPSDEFLSVLPLYHVLGFTAGLLAPMGAGATVTYVDLLTPTGLLEAMTATRTTIMIGVPRLYALLARRIGERIDSAPLHRRALHVPLCGVAHLSRGLARVIPPLAPVLRRLRAALYRPVHSRFGGRIRLLVSGGAPLAPDVFHALDLMGFTTCEGYGLTETSPVLTLNRPARPRCGTAGSPLPGVELRIEQPDEEGVGDVMVRGACVFSGYFGDEEATRRAFSGDWFRTGDRGRVERDGHLVLAGRADDVIVTGAGKNVYPDEIEWLYREVPHVKEFFVVGWPEPGSAGQAPHAVIVLDDAEDAPPVDACRREIESALSRISRGLPGYQRIRRVHFWDRALPRTSALKVKRRQVRRVLIEEQSSPGDARS